MLWCWDTLIVLNTNNMTTELLILGHLGHLGQNRQHIAGDGDPPPQYCEPMSCPTQISDWQTREL